MYDLCEIIQMHLTLPVRNSGPIPRSMITFHALRSYLFKGVINVNSSKPLCKDEYVRFTLVHLESLSGKV